MSKENHKIIKNIKENYRGLEEGIVNQLYFKGHHGSTTGSYREKIWKEMFAGIIPKKFVIEQSVFLIDSKGNVSNEVDLAIFDETYTPYIFRYYNLKFIPIEAVAVVVECKSTSMKKETLKNWVDSILAVKTSPCQKSFVRTISGISCQPPQAQTATRPLRILCCLNDEYRSLLDEDESKKMFDVVIRAKEKEKKLYIEWDKDKKNLFEWYLCLNHAEGLRNEISGGKTTEHHLDEYKVYDHKTELSLMTFNFQLNQVLMLINNPMLFPHLDYAEMFNNQKDE